MSPQERTCLLCGFLLGDLRDLLWLWHGDDSVAVDTRAALPSGLEVVGFSAFAANASARWGSVACERSAVALQRLLRRSDDPPVRPGCAGVFIALLDVLLVADLDYA